MTGSSILLGVTDVDRDGDANLSLAEAVFASVGMLRRRARQVAGESWSQETLTGAQLELLRLVRRQPGIAVTKAASELGLATNTVSTLVGRLDEAGLLRKARDADDRRVARLRLTASAQRQAEKWHDRRVTLVADAITRLEPAQRVELEKAVSAITDLAGALRDAP